METWADKKMEELESKGRENWDADDWDADDWEAYHYIEQLRFEGGYYDD